MLKMFVRTKEEDLIIPEESLDPYQRRKVEIRDRLEEIRSKYSKRTAEATPSFVSAQISNLIKNLLSSKIMDSGNLQIWEDFKVDFFAWQVDPELDPKVFSDIDRDLIKYSRSMNLDKTIEDRHNKHIHKEKYLQTVSELKALLEASAAKYKADADNTLILLKQFRKPDQDRAADLRVEISRIRKREKKEDDIRIKNLAMKNLGINGGIDD